MLSLERLRAPVRDEHVCFFEELEQDLDALFSAQVQNEALLAGVFQIEVQILMRIGWPSLVRRGVTQVVTLRRLDFHDLGTQVGQNTTNRWRRDERRHLDNLS